MLLLIWQLMVVLNNKLLLKSIRLHLLSSIVKNSLYLGRFRLRTTQIHSCGLRNNGNIMSLHSWELISTAFFTDNFAVCVGKQRVSIHHLSSQ
jgi:hypothetical protein